MKVLDTRKGLKRSWRSERVGQGVRERCKGVGQKG